MNFHIFTFIGAAKSGRKPEGESQNGIWRMCDNFSQLKFKFGYFLKSTAYISMEIFNLPAVGRVEAKR